MTVRNKRPYHDREWLAQKYIKESMSINQIAKLCNVSYEAVRKALVKYRIPRREKGNPFERGNAWKGGRIVKPSGYIKVWNGKDYDYEHRIVAQKMLSRPLRREEIVHHINRIKGDNSDHNLHIFPSQSEHASTHKRGVANAH